MSLKAFPFKPLLFIEQCYLYLTFEFSVHHYMILRNLLKSPQPLLDYVKFPLPPPPNNRHCISTCQKLGFEHGKGGCLFSYLIDIFKVPMKWKIEVLKNRLIWKAFKSEEEWHFPFCPISSRSRDIQDFCIMQIRYWWRHKVCQNGSQNTK